MRNLLIFACLITSTLISVFAQNVERDRVLEKVRQDQAADQEYERLKKISEQSKRNYSVNAISPSAKPQLSKEQIARRRPDKEDFASYANFLNLPKTGLIKLFPDLGCWKPHVIQVNDACQDAIPLSNYYSFRKKEYLGQGLFDIGLKDNVLFSDGLLSQGIIVILGNVPIESISTSSNGMKFLADYQPARRNEDILINSKKLDEGMKDGNYQYAMSAPIIENTTYGIRVIAYNGKILVPINKRFSFNPLEGDKRVDIIVVFRLVRKDTDGSLTLLWRELQRMDSPKIKVPKKE